MDSIDFLVPLRLGALDIHGPELSYGFFGERRVEFMCERRDFDEVPRQAGVRIEGPWSVCYACQGFGLMDAAAAGGMMALAFAQGAGGAFFGPERGVSRTFAETKVELDTILSVALGRHDLFVARYPELAEQPGDGPYDTIVTRYWMGDPPRVVGENVTHLPKR